MLINVYFIHENILFVFILLKTIDGLNVHLSHLADTPIQSDLHSECIHFLTLSFWSPVGIEPTTLTLQILPTEPYRWEMFFPLHSFKHKKCTCVFHPMPHLKTQFWIGWVKSTNPNHLHLPPALVHLWAHRSGESWGIMKSRGAAPPCVFSGKGTLRPGT
jgi:hypothetical protein